MSPLSNIGVGIMALFCCACLIPSKTIDAAVIVSAQSQFPRSSVANCSFPESTRLAAANPGDSELGPCVKWTAPSFVRGEPSVDYYLRLRCESATSLTAQIYSDAACEWVLRAAATTRTAISSCQPSGTAFGITTAAGSGWQRLQCFDTSKKTPAGRGADADPRITISEYNDSLLNWDESAAFLATYSDAPVSARLCYSYISADYRSQSLFYFSVDVATGAASEIHCADTKCKNCASAKRVFTLEARTNKSKHYDMSQMMSHTSLVTAQQIRPQYTTSAPTTTSTTTTSTTSTSSDGARGVLPIAARFTGRILNVTAASYFAEHTGFEATSSLPIDCGRSTISSLSAFGTHYFPLSPSTCVQSTVLQSLGKTQRKFTCSNATGVSVLSQLSFGVPPGTNAARTLSYSVTDCMGQHYSTTSFSGCYITPNTDMRRNNLECFSIKNRIIVPDDETNMNTTDQQAVPVLALVFQIASVASEESVKATAATLSMGAPVRGTPVIGFGIAAVVFLAFVIGGSAFYLPDGGACSAGVGSFFASALPTAEKDARHLACMCLAILAFVASVLAVLSNPPPDYDGLSNGPIAWFTGAGWEGLSWVRQAMAADPTSIITVTSCPDFSSLVRLAGELCVVAVALPLPGFVFFGFLSLLMCDDDFCQPQSKVSDVCGTYWTFGGGFFFFVVAPIAIAASRISYNAAIACGQPLLLEAAFHLALMAVFVLVSQIFFFASHALHQTTTILSSKLMWHATFFGIGMAGASVTVHEEGDVTRVYIYLAAALLVYDLIVDFYSLALSNLHQSGVADLGTAVLLAIPDGLVGAALIGLSGHVVTVGGHATQIEVVVLVATIFGAVPTLFVMLAALVKGLGACRESVEECWDEVEQERAAKKAAEAAAEANWQRREKDRRDAEMKQLQKDQRNATEMSEAQGRAQLEHEQARDRSACEAQRQFGIDDMNSSVTVAPNAVLKKGVTAADAGVWTLLWNDNPSVKTILPLPAQLFPAPSAVSSAAHSPSRRYVILTSTLQPDNNNNNSVAWLFDMGSNSAGNHNNMSSSPTTTSSTPQLARASIGVCCVPRSVSHLLANQLEPALLHLVCAASYFYYHGKSAAAMMQHVKGMLDSVQQAAADLAASEAAVLRVVKAELEKIQEQQMQHARNAGSLVSSASVSAAPSPSHPDNRASHHHPGAAVPPPPPPPPPPMGGAAALAASALEAVNAIHTTASGHFDMSSMTAHHHGPRGNMLVSARDPLSENNNNNNTQIPLAHRWSALCGVVKGLEGLVTARGDARRNYRRVMKEAAAFVESLSRSTSNSDDDAKRLTGAAGAASDSAAIVEAVKTLEEIVQALQETNVAQQMGAFLNALQQKQQQQQQQQQQQTASSGGRVQDMLNLVCHYQPASDGDAPLPPLLPLPGRLEKELLEEAAKCKPPRQQLQQQQQQSFSAASTPAAGETISNGNNNNVGGSRNKQPFDAPQFARNLTTRNCFSWQLVGMLAADLRPLELCIAEEVVPALRGTSQSQKKPRKNTIR